RTCIVPGFRVGDPQRIHESRSIAVLRSQSLREMSDRLGGLLPYHQQSSELKVRRAEVWLAFDRSLVMADGLVQFPRAFQHRAQIAVRLGITRARLQRLSERSFGLRESLSACEIYTIVVVTLRQVWIDGHGLSIRRLHHVAASGTGIQSDQVRMSLRQFGIQFYRFLMLRDGL